MVAVVLIEAGGIGAAMLGIPVVCRITGLA
jgi:hypothetical protein